MSLNFDCKIILFSLFSFLLSISEVNGQTTGFYISRGNSVSFYFSTINEIQTGITYNDFAQLIARNDGSDLNGASWDLSVRANSILPNSLPLEVIEVRADIAASEGTSTGWRQLDNTLGSVTLISNGSIFNPNMIIDISYRVGDAGNTVQMVGYPSDYYKVDLIFEMIFHP